MNTTFTGVLCQTLRAYLHAWATTIVRFQIIARETGHAFCPFLEAGVTRRRTRLAGVTQGFIVMLKISAQKIN